jgi:hypothetical protein
LSAYLVGKDDSHRERIEIGVSQGGRYDDEELGQAHEGRTWYASELVTTMEGSVFY